jgi:hypothetical protein
MQTFKIQDLQLKIATGVLLEGPNIGTSQAYILLALSDEGFKNIGCTKKSFQRTTIGDLKRKRTTIGDLKRK